MEIIYRNLADLVPNPKNPRQQGPDGIEGLAESIKNNPAFFEARPVLLSNRTGKLVIIAGERRSEAARYLEMEKVPTILMEGLTEEQEDEIMVRDNAHAGIWDNKKLQDLQKMWGGDKMKKWAQNVSWVPVSSVDIAGLFKEEKHAKESGEKWHEITIICSPDIDVQAVKARLAEVLQNEFAENVKIK